jgi:AcrR family transcriptional regulator
VKRSAARGVSRDRLIEVSRDILEREGAEQLTIRRIADAVDRTQPAIYQHFASKDEILAALAVDGFAALAERLAKAPKRSMGERLSAIATAYVQFGLERPRLYRVMFVEPAVIPFARPTTPQPAQEAFRIIAEAIRGVSELDAARTETVTEVIWGALHGFVTLSITDRYRPGSAMHRRRLRILHDVVRAMAVASNETIDVLIQSRIDAT